MRDAFSSFHPLVILVYFIVVLGCGMAFLHPVMQAISLVGAASYSALLKGRKALEFNLTYMLPLLVLIAVCNPLFSHAGATILFYLDNGNPVTLESLLYGIASACMFVTILIWFSCFHVVMTSDKIIYLFGNMMPSLSLLLSMTLRFVPRYTAQLKVVSNAQRCIGRDASQGNAMKRARHGLRIVSILTTWALENAIETADSMRSRGYGLPGRTSFSLFRFDRRDRAASLLLVLLIAAVGASVVAGQHTIRFFPSIQFNDATPVGVIGYSAYGILCLFPALVQIVEEMKWKSIASKT